MCNGNNELLNNGEYVNLQTGEVLDMERVSELKDNAMLKKRIALWCEWDFEKNSALGFDVWEMTYGSNKKVWWFGECGHEWEVSPNVRVKGSGCPYCSNNKTNKKFNTINITHPVISKLLLNTEDGDKYSYGSNKKVDWKCNECGCIIRNRMIRQIIKLGFTCPSCGDGVSYPEKFMFNLLSTLNVNIKAEFRLECDKSKRYDFYIPNLNVIIETHGKQHYKEGFKTTGGKSLEEEQANDQYKYKLAIQNGIKPENYIVIDCRESDFAFIKGNILKSRLSEIFDLSEVDWRLIASISEKSLVVMSWDLFKEGLDLDSISKKISVDRQTVIRYLHRGAKLKVVDFNPITKRKIVQMDLNGVLIKEWESIADASMSLTGKIDTSLNYALRGISHNYEGYKWMYLEDYEKQMKNPHTTNPIVENKKSRIIVQLDLNDTYVGVWESIVSASKSVSGSRTSIASVCKGTQKTSHGFKWMYKEDYDKHINEQYNDLIIEKYI